MYEMKHLAVNLPAHAKIRIVQRALEAELHRKVNQSETVERMYDAWAAAQPQEAGQ